MTCTRPGRDACGWLQGPVIGAKQECDIYRRLTAPPLRATRPESQRVRRKPSQGCVQSSPRNRTLARRGESNIRAPCVPQSNVRLTDSLVGCDVDPGHASQKSAVWLKRRDTE